MGDEKLLKEMGLRINVRRKQLMMTQEQLAEKMDVSIQMISNLELGKKAIRPENIVKLCDILGVSTDYILRGKHADYEMLSIIEGYRKLNWKNQQLIQELVNALSRKDS